MIVTNNPKHPRLSLPISYEVLPILTVDPPNLSLGTVKLNEPQTKSFNVRSALPEKVSLEVLNHPAECSIRESRDHDGLYLSISTTLTSPGAWQDEISLRVKTDSGSQDVSIRCSGYAR